MAMSFDSSISHLGPTGHVLVNQMNFGIIISNVITERMHHSRPKLNINSTSIQCPERWLATLQQSTPVSTVGIAHRSKSR